MVIPVGVRRNGVIGPITLKLRNKLRLSGQLYLGEDTLSTQMSPRDGLDDTEDRTLAPAETGIPDRPARILITPPTDLSWLTVTV